jgi:hypothetical protein
MTTIARSPGRAGSSVLTDRIIESALVLISKRAGLSRTEALEVLVVAGRRSAKPLAQVAHEYVTVCQR